jgi:aldehyde:ferredoxin oxidoreductase
MLKIGDLRAVARANALCNDYGMDAISTGGTLAYAVEAFREGLIDEEVTGGLALDWGRPDLLVELIPRIARREGFGDQLAEGSRFLSARYGGEEFAIQVKGLECPMHDPRALWSMALGYATSIRGGCHNRDTNLGLEMGMDSLEEIGFPGTLPQRRVGKAQMTVHSQAIGAICDAAVICLFAWKGAGSSLALLRDMVNAVTGYGFSLEDLMETGNRIWYLKRALCNLCGTTREDDRVPRRIIEPHLDGEASFLLGALNPLLRSTNRLVGRIRSERLLHWVKEFNRRVILRHTFRIVTLAAKVLPSARPSTRGSRADGPAGPEGGRVDFDFMLEEFYRLRRLDARGFPETAVLERYGLEEVSRVLHGNNQAG